MYLPKERGHISVEIVVGRDLRAVAGNLEQVTGVGTNAFAAPFPPTVPRQGEKMGRTVALKTAGVAAGWAGLAEGPAVRQPVFDQPQQAKSLVLRVSFRAQGVRYAHGGSGGSGLSDDSNRFHSVTLFAHPGDVLRDRLGRVPD